MKINDLQNLVALRDQPIKFGFEKEFVLQARSLKNSELYNLNLATELIESLTKKKLLDEYSVRPEYSKCLVEIVSKPYDSRQVFQELDNINNTQSVIETELKNLVRQKYPEIDERFEASVSDQGSSPSSQYLNPDLSIKSDQTDAIELVLPEYRKLVSSYKNIEIEVGGRSESAIGLYNHINSFHITFHPTYKKGATSFSNYIRAAQITQSLVSKYQVYDRGNNRLYRGNKYYHFHKNVRDVFFEIFLSEKFGSLPARLLLSKDVARAETEFIHLSKHLLKKSGTDHLDRAYSNWSAINIRPRVIENIIPALEIRQFGSNFSRTSEITQLLKEIIEYDSREFYA